MASSSEVNPRQRSANACVRPSELADGSKPVSETSGVDPAAECDVGLDEQRRDAERLAHRAAPVVDLESRFEQLDDIVEVVATQGAERAGEGEVGGDGRGAGLFDQLSGPFELEASLLVGASGRMLPGQHLDGGCDVGDEAELGAELG